MKNILKIFFSYRFIILMLSVLALGAAVATFIENDFDAQTAKLVVYNSLWYELVMISLGISLLGIIIKTKMYKRMGAFVFHLGFIFVLLGAGVTRYYGYEGVIHIREGHSEHRVVSEESYLQVVTEDKILKHRLSLSKLGSNNFTFNDTLNGKDLTLEFVEYNFKRGQKLEQVTVKVTYDGESKDLTINGGHGSYEAPTLINFGEFEFGLMWGSKLIELPFKVKLNDFQIERYPGSESPSSYASEVTVQDGSSTFDYRIFMNHPLVHQNYKFFQSSYDRDEKGTVLSVNNDPGKWPTYFAYFLLSLGFVLNFFTKNSRFDRLRIFLNKSNISLVFLALMLVNVDVSANDEFLNKFDKNTKEFSKHFETLHTQDYNGRIKPMGTEAMDILNKMSGTDSLYSLSSSQIMLGILVDPSYWEKIKLIKIKNKELKQQLNIPDSQKHIAFNDVFTDEGKYIFNEQINLANEKAPATRNAFDNDLIKLDERLNIFYMITKGIFFKFVPLSEDPSLKWYSPQELTYESWVDDEVKESLINFVRGISLGIENNDWIKASNSLEYLKENQVKYSSALLPSETQTNIEILFNNTKVFPNLMLSYILVGLIALFVALFSIFANKELPKVRFVFFSLLVLGFIVHTAGLGMRWYISGHAPWSDTYESLIYVSWSAVLAGVVVFRNSLLSISSAAILAGIVLFVANLSFISPQITPLVPVLKSYWLSIHVSVITASYGFFGLSSMLGLFSLILMSIKNPKNTENVNTQIRQISAINEISIIIGLSLLTVGNFIGGVWANESWGRYWGWDPKETWSFISIVVYTIVIHLRFIPKLNSLYIFSVTSFMSFSAIIMTYFGVNFYLSGMHSYASGDKIPVPDFIYIAAVFAVIISLIAYKGRDVKVVR